MTIVASIYRELVLLTQENRVVIVNNPGLLTKTRELGSFPQLWKPHVSGVGA
jgi:hypothetical protein